MKYRHVLTMIAVVLSITTAGCFFSKSSPNLVAEGKNLVPKLCVGCHPLETVKDHKDNKAGWFAVIDDMKSRGAQISSDEQEAMAAYLAETQPK